MTFPLPRRASTLGLASISAIALFLAAPVTAQDPAQKPKPERRTRTAAGQANIRESRKASVEFRNPDTLEHKSFNSLTLTTGTFPNVHPANVTASHAFELLCYNGKPVGPTIRVRRGTTFHIRLRNELDPSVDAHPNPPDPPTNGFSPNPKAQAANELCTTNLHTHGLHVSPANNADNILDIAVGPKGDARPQEFTFEYTVPADHPSGTFWYHPHRHGSVAYQLSNGVAGALLIDGTPGDSIHDLDDVPEVAQAKEQIMVFQLYNYRTGTDNVGRIDASTIYNVNPDAYACTAVKFSGPPPPDNVVPQVTAINGVINPVIHIRPGEVQRWRMIHAAWDVQRNLTIYNDHDAPAADMPFYEIALDGLATGKREQKAAVSLAPGQRSDVLIQAPALNAGEAERVYHLYQGETVAAKSPHGRKQDPNYLAKIVIRGEPTAMQLPAEDTFRDCRPFASIADGELSKTPTFTNLVFSATDGGSTPPNDVPHYTINGDVYDHNATRQIRLGTAEEWVITAETADGKSSHPFHIHVNAFQVVSHFDGKTTHKMDQWRDTLFIPEGESYTIRSRFKDFLGRTVLHCHILDHEDQGMMMNIEFIPPDQTPKAVKGPPLAPIKSPAPALRLSEAKGATFDLATLRGHQVALVFFQGAECSHCAESLRGLVLEAREATEADLEIVAVSGRKVADEARTRAALGVSPADRFHLLVDESHGSFRNWGCDSDTPRHGLFLIDVAGYVRARYVGDTPFADVREVVRILREMGAATDKTPSTERKFRLRDAEGVSRPFRGSPRT